ncbi:hypothetical protein PHYSODRAFT_516700 [Phytophthora sojae]|uniref:BZIP domain-containing protein n=1 Tax=Phytophthora sojae (strain P6497) TaxID=1094619 RepID=G4ZVX3_PHYSP|nr:hypothetical protein PHYSODRAFT_516700 [Phytophthora sojae]EGZ11553.1 hypothetical protein PHYSODRAFT_516700 [Phytophthora sojae]|eukprot:XP_009531886.1 hypothetical protein PHYSODRAFT_516700 [Phytophthora sojae]
MEWEAPIPVWIESISIDVDDEDMAAAEFMTSIPVRKPTAKPAHRTRRRIDVDPIGRKENRKDKQRGYEKGYRKRQKDKRADDEVEWMQLEAQVRTLLAKRTAARYLELLQEERALREAEALDRCMAARDVALSLWGTCATRRNVREQLNALPGLRECLTFEFSW